MMTLFCRGRKLGPSTRQKTRSSYFPIQSLQPIITIAYDEKKTLITNYWRIWINFMAQYLLFFGSLQFSQFFGFPTFSP
jgi:hypothetical protein